MNERDAQASPTAGVLALASALVALASTLFPLLYEAAVFGAIGGAARWLADARLLVAAAVIGTLAGLVAMVAGALAVRSTRSRTLGVVALVLVALAAVSWAACGALYWLVFVLLDPAG